MLTCHYLKFLGFELVTPWGLVHKCRGFRNKTKTSLLPFVEEDNTEGRKKALVERKLEGLEELKLSQRVKRLEKMNLFLEEYVVNTSFLDSLRKERPPNQQHKKQQDEEVGVSLQSL